MAGLNIEQMRLAESEARQNASRQTLDLMSQVVEARTYKAEQTCHDLTAALLRLVHPSGLVNIAVAPPNSKLRVLVRFLNSNPGASISQPGNRFF